ncbi:hypothetical protein S7S_06100 [Isoalcanivorax pacificus W11-5]|uniref:Uncharacterized protein n=1 Tax=Isoalcanivorax pacificus W11-5 TaxID=391936 RepID=A0A0B4XKL5_9GAMM|nr:hypothetical protein [Isoalcanivorax pacificus]AJD47636.1 hypothetical protein S7S_06100 [Isoalcanivorax pacificus W11-5]
MFLTAVLLRRRARACGVCALLALLLAAAGCTPISDVVMPWVPQVTPPARVGGLTYAGIDELGALHGPCAYLGDLHTRGLMLPETEFELVLEACTAQVMKAEEEEAERLRAEEERAIAEMMAREWQAVEAAREQEWREAERRRQEAELLRAQLAAAEQKERERREALLQRISQANVQRELAGVPDKPIAHNLSQPLKTTLKTFLSCIELAYPNKGYQIARSGRTLTVIMREAELPRGDLAIESRFVENPEYWRMTYLRVADIEARTDADRFVLSQNLTAESCPQEGGLF